MKLFQRWGVQAALLIIPFTAIMHNRIFYRSECMLNSVGPDYYPDVIVRWLRRDPSLPLGIGFALIAYLLGKRWPTIRALSIIFFVSFIPISFWVWDIPFTHRIICAKFHDSHSFLRAWHLYALGAVTFVLLLARHWFRSAQIKITSVHP